MFLWAVARSPEEFSTGNSKVFIQRNRHKKSDPIKGRFLFSGQTVCFY
jgi:hypothetical protein